MSLVGQLPITQVNCLVEVPRPRQLHIIRGAKDGAKSNEYKTSLEESWKSWKRKRQKVMEASMNEGQLDGSDVSATLVVSC